MKTHYSNCQCHDCDRKRLQELRTKAEGDEFTLRALGRLLESYKEIVDDLIGHLEDADPNVVPPYFFCSYCAAIHNHEDGFTCEKCERLLCEECVDVCADEHSESVSRNADRSKLPDDPPTCESCGEGPDADGICVRRITEVCEKCFSTFHAAVSENDCEVIEEGDV